jgi:hypothetical protein
MNFRLWRIKRTSEWIINFVVPTLLCLTMVNESPSWSSDLESIIANSFASFQYKIPSKYNCHCNAAGHRHKQMDKLMALPPLEQFYAFDFSL